MAEKICLLQRENIAYPTGKILLDIQKLAAKGVALQTLSSLMGHSDISVTAKYYINVPAAEKIEAIKALSA